jgi:nucleotidyltransferase substrate binding protein (TIGR01987 family)
MKLILNKIDISNLKKAYAQLDSAIPTVKTDLERAGAIQYFEYCYELAWSTTRKILIALGKEPANNPRMVFREAAQNNLITDPQAWFEFIEYRNQTVHTYNENTAKAIFSILPRFKDHLAELILKMESLS